MAITNITIISSTSIYEEDTNQKYSTIATYDAPEVSAKCRIQANENETHISVDDCKYLITGTSVYIELDDTSTHESVITEISYDREVTSRLTSTVQYQDNILHVETNRGLTTELSKDERIELISTNGIEFTGKIETIDSDTQLTLKNSIPAGLIFENGTKTTITLGPKITISDAIPVGRFVPVNANISVIKRDVTLDSYYGCTVIIDDPSAPQLTLHQDAYCGQFNVPSVGNNISGKIVTKYDDQTDEDNFHIINT